MHIKKAKKEESISLADAIKKSGFKQDLIAEWVYLYLKHKLSFFNKDKLKSLKIRTEKDASVETEDSIYVILNSLSEEGLKKAKEKKGNKKKLVIVALNTRKNVLFVIDSWKQLSKEPWLSVMFINPKNEGDTKWFLCPATHASVADKSALKKGLLTLYRNVRSAK